MRYSIFCFPPHIFNINNCDTMCRLKINLKVHKDCKHIEWPSSQANTIPPIRCSTLCEDFPSFPLMSARKKASRPGKPSIRRCVHTTWFTGHQIRSSFRIPESSSDCLQQEFPILTQLPTLSLMFEAMMVVAVVFCWLNNPEVSRKHTLILKVFHRPALVITRV